MYIRGMSEDKDVEGLHYLKWSDFDCPHQEGSGYKFMEKEPVFILEKAITMTTLLPTKITLAYVSPQYASTLCLEEDSSHRIGRAIEFTCATHKSMMLFVAALCSLGVRRMRLSPKTIYFDTDHKFRGESLEILFKC